MIGRRLLFLLFVFLSTTAIAQNASVRAEKYRMRIGEQIELLLKAEANKGQKIVWPAIADSIGPFFNVISRDTIDTLASAGNGLSLEQKIQITSFDSGMHSLPVFDFLFINSGSDTTSILSDVLSIEVKTIPVDTTKAIKDIRGLEDVPEDFTDLILYSILAAVALVAIAIGIYYYQKRKKPVQIIVPKGPVTPPWEIALATLDKIEREAVWKSGNDKLYHSSISEALRTYVEAQLKLPALESTTDETLALLQRSLKQQEAIDFIRQVLVLADLVKFAKEKPLPVEHERSLTLAKQFVLLTKPQVSNDAEKEVNNG
jgi:hypothetical protein